MFFQRDLQMAGLKWGDYLALNENHTVFVLMRLREMGLQREGNVTTKVGTGVTWPKAKGMPAATEAAGGQVQTLPLEGERPC